MSDKKYVAMMAEKLRRVNEQKRRREEMEKGDDSEEEDDTPPPPPTVVNNIVNNTNNTTNNNNNIHIHIHVNEPPTQSTLAAVVGQAVAAVSSSSNGSSSSADDVSKPFEQTEQQALYVIPEKDDRGRMRAPNGNACLNCKVTNKWDPPVPKLDVFTRGKEIVTGLLANHKNEFSSTFEPISPAMVKLSKCSRFGLNVEEWVMAYRSHQPGIQVRDAKPDLQVNGVPTSKGQHKYDWLEVTIVDTATGKLLKQRVECKGATMVYNTTHKHWQIVFKCIKVGQFDKLFLCTPTEEGLAIFEAKALCVVDAGAQGEVRGGNIVWTASTKFQCPCKALKSMLKEYGKVHDRIATLPYDDPVYQPILTQETAGAQMFKDTPAAPLAALSPSMRALVVEDIFEYLSTKIFAGHKLTRPTTDAEVGKDKNGQKRTRHNVAYDFLLDGRVRIELKSSMLSWDTTHNFWHAAFCNVLFDAHNRCFLVLVAPDALHIIEHRTDGGGGKNGEGVGVSTDGKSTDVTGHTISICGSTGALDEATAEARVDANKQLKKQTKKDELKKEYLHAGKPATAVDHILKKLIFGGSVYVARVEL